VGLLTEEMLTETHNSRSLDRRHVYLGEGLTFEIEARDAWLEAEAIDITHEGLGVAVVLATDITMPAVGEVVTVRYTGRGGSSGARQQAVVRHIGSLQTGRGTLPRIGLSLVCDTTTVADVERREGARYPCPDALPAFAAASCPWFFGETLRFRIMRVGAGGMTLRTTRPNPPLPPRAELDLELHLASIAVESGRGRLTSVRRDDANGGFEVGVAWIDPPRDLLNALSRYLLAGDETLTPASLRDGGLTVRGVERAVTYDYATSSADYDEILALRLHAHQAEGHLDSASVADLRSPFDAHSRHLTCRFGGRIVGYVRVIFVDGDPARSQYVALGGHEVPQWLWDAGFVEGGAGATHPDFQRAGLYVPLMQHMFRVAVQSGHRFVLGACPDELLGMYRDMGFDVLEERIVEPKPGWSFRSHLLYADAERLLQDPPTSRTVAAMASAIGFAGLRAAA
jgi:GNAT superfamily N-acetyltransferase